MSLPDIWSRRKRLASGVKDVFQYDVIPVKLRQQTLFIFADLQKTIGSRSDISSSVCEIMREELGVLTLGRGYPQTTLEELYNWFVDPALATTDDVLDAIELYLRMAYYSAHRMYEDIVSGCDAIVRRLNARFKEAGVGYQFVDNEIIKTANAFTHEEVVLPALNLLSQSRFATANEECRKAFDEFRAASYADCLVDCCKSFESVLKVIGKARGWEIKETDPASKLISAAFAHKFIPDYMQTQFGALRTMLESSVPTTRNKQGGHGAGNEANQVPEHLAAFQLHQTASILVFLGECDRQA